MVSTARDEALRRAIERVLDDVWERSGGIGLLQDMALLGHVYGHVDLVLRVDWEALARGGNDLQASAAIRIEVVEPRRGVAVLDERDYRRIKAYIMHHERDAAGAPEPTVIERLLGRARRTREGKTRRIVEVLSADAWQVYEDDELVWEQRARGIDGQPPVVHIQNISQPFEYEGMSEVEALIPLQDELNTRLSDRASRVTMQSFKMYLAKGLDAAPGKSVGPGQVWWSDNPDAEVTEFGGDGNSPSEESHIREVRQALDKASGVPPLASGVVQAKIGNLSSANALKITLMGILSKTARKRVMYGGGMARMSALVLGALDAAGVFKTDPVDRGIRLNWPDPLPADERDQVFAAEAKVRLGVPVERVLAELGYAPTDPGVT